MKTIFRIALMALILTGCAAIPPTTHKFGGVTMTWVRTETSPRVESEGNVCTVYAPEPEYLHDTEKMLMFGEATLHCFNGESAALPITKAVTDSRMPHTRNRDTMYVGWTRTPPSLPDGGMCPQPSTGGLVVLLGGQTKACTFFTGADSCQVFSVKPVSDNDSVQIARLGHEVLHCFIGYYHPQ